MNLRSIPQRIRNRLERKLHERSAKKRYKHLQDHIILIYTMGKVGSSTIYHTLRHELPHTHVFQVHFLSDHWLKEKLPGMDPMFHHNIDDAEQVFNCIRKHPDSPVHIITLVREPLSRDISDIFQNWKANFDSLENLDLDELREFAEQNDHEYTLNWFDTEFKNFTGFDIYSKPFQKEEGWVISSCSKGPILCITLESFRERADEAFETFLGLKGVKWIQRNKTSNKKGAGLYEEMMNNFKPSKEHLNRLYSHKLVTHFYPEEQISLFRRRWS